MTDYDPRSIPILDDVIEIDEAEKTDLAAPDAINSAPDNSADSDGDAFAANLYETEPVQAEHNLDLFAAGATDSVAEPQITEIPAVEDAAAEEVEPQIGIIDDINDEDFSTVIHSHDVETDQRTGLVTSEATTDEDNSPIPTATLEAETDVIESALIDYDAITAAPPVNIEPQPAQQPVSLESVVEGITRQLMPDLEQQLRFLITQALEDNLPDEVIKQLTSKQDKPH